ncbi:MAG: RCC1 domain-containing protein [Hominimerdicola sp.]
MNKTKIISFITAVTLAFSAFAMPVTVYGEDETNVVSQTSINSDEMSVSATNSFGELMTNVIESKTDEQQENQGYNIFSIEMDGSTANVSFETMEDCTLVVGIFDEQGQKMICSGSKEVTKEETETTIEIETTSMPQYYYLKGFMIRNTDFTPLCTDYASPNYTKEMQEFFTKTTEDFDEDRVLNLDEDTTNNFAVFSDEVKVIEPVSGVNIVTSADIENDKYVIENVDDSITSLNVGDTFAYEYEEGNYLIVQIASINVDGTTVIITGADTSMEDAFDYVKIDNLQDVSEAEVDNSTCDDSVTYNGFVNLTETQNSFYSMNNELCQTTNFAIENEGTYKNALSYTIKEKKNKDNNSSDSDSSSNNNLSFDFKYNIDATFDVSCESSLKYYISTSYQYLEVKVDVTAKLSGTIEGTGNVEYQLGMFIFPIVSGVTLTITPKAIFELSISIELSGTLTYTVGFSYSGDDGFKNISKKPEFSTQLESTGTIFIGLEFTPEIKLLSKHLASAEFSAKAGVELTSQMTSESEEDCEHSCNNCLSGDIRAKVNFSAEAKIFNITQSITFEPLSLKITDFYYSFDHEEFGWGTCPYKSYKVTVHLCDTNGEPLTNGVINDRYHTCEWSSTSFYLPNGEYTLTAKKSGYYDQSGDIEVADGPVELTLTLAERSELDINQTISMASKCSAAITEDGKLYTWGTNLAGMLGNGEFKESSTVSEYGIGVELYEPYHVMDNIRSVSVGQSNIAAITTDGKLYMSGTNQDGLIGNGTYDYDNCFGVITWAYKIKNDNKFQYVYPLGHNVASVSLGNTHCGAVTKDGKLYMWGDNQYGQVGLDEETLVHKATNALPTIIEPFDVPRVVMNNVAMVSCSGNTTAVVNQDGELYMWGGISINNTTKPISSPQKINGIDNAVYVNVEAGSQNCAIITETGELYIVECIYTEEDGVPSITSTITKKSLDDQIVSAVYPSQNAYITNKGELYQWNIESNKTWNDTYEEENKQIYEPTKISGEIADNLSQLAGHSALYTTFTCAAVTQDGKLYMKGDNTYGQLGDGTTTSSDTPKQVLFDGEDKRILQFDTEDETTEEESAETTSANLLGNVAFSIESNSKESEVCAASTDLSSNQVLYSTVSSSGNTYTFSGLEENKEYIFYVMKSRKAAEPFSSDNLLYIAQGVSDSVGEITFESNPKSTVSNADIFLGGESARDINDAEITIENFEYDEKEHTPSCTVVYNGKTLVAGEDYDVTGDFFVTKQGTYSLTITGMGDYTGTVTKNFYVKGTNVQYMNVTLSKTAYVYTGNAIKPKITVINGDDTLVSGTDYAVRYENNIDAGTAKVIIAGKGDYTGKVTKTFQIFENVTDISSCTVSISKSSYPYTGSAVKPTVTVRNGDTVLTKNTDYVVRYINNINIGTATIIISGKGDYIGTTNKTFSIVKNIGKCTVTLSTESCNYTGSAIKPKVTVKYGNTTLTMGTDYVMRYANNVNVGTASVVISGCNSYAGTITKTFEIVDNTINLSKCEITLSKTNYTYTGSAIKPKVTVKYNGETLVSGTDYAVRYMDNTEKSTATVIISGKGNYSGRIEKTFTIS